MTKIKSRLRALNPDKKLVCAWITDHGASGVIHSRPLLDEIKRRQGQS